MRSTRLPLDCNAQQIFALRSFEDLKGGCELFRESTLRRGLLEADNSAAGYMGREGGTLHSVAVWGDRAHVPKRKGFALRRRTRILEVS